VSVLPLVTVIALLVGFVASLVLLFRSGEMRAGLLGAVLALLLVHPALTLWQEPARSIGFDAATAADGAYLLAGLLCLFVVAALWRTLGERDRIESLHWDAMEGVRALGELGGARSADGREPLPAARDRLHLLRRRGGRRLARGRQALRGDRDLRAGDPPGREGAVFPLEETCCAGVLGAARPVAWAARRRALLPTRSASRPISEPRSGAPTPPTARSASRASARAGPPSPPPTATCCA
jgi:hypothetical protein